MAKYTKKRSRKGRARRGPYKKRRNTIKGVSRKVDKLYSAIEYKHFDRTELDSPITALGTCFHLTQIPVGDADNQRDGDKLTTTSLQLRMSLAQNNIERNKLRVLIVKVRDATNLDHQNGIIMRDRIFQSPIIQGATKPFLWKYNVDYFRSSGARILYDQYFDLSQPTYVAIAGSDPDQGVPKTKYIKKKFLFRKNIQFTAGTVNQNHGIWLFAWANNALPGDAPRLSFTTRLNYIDL